MTGASFGSGIPDVKNDIILEKQQQCLKSSIKHINHRTQIQITTGYCL